MFKVILGHIVVISLDSMYVCVHIYTCHTDICIYIVLVCFLVLW